MKVKTLHAILSKAIQAGNGHKPVCVNKDSLYDGNGTFELCDINGTELRWSPNNDGDGGTKMNFDGTEAGRIRFILIGNSGE